MLQQDFAVILLDVNMPGHGRLRDRGADPPPQAVGPHADHLPHRVRRRGAAPRATPRARSITSSTPVVPEILRAKVRVFVDLFRMTAAGQAAGRGAGRPGRGADAAGGRRGGQPPARRSWPRPARVLANSLDLEATARDLARLAVPVLADLAARDAGRRAGRPLADRAGLGRPAGAAGRACRRPDGPDDACGRPSARPGRRRIRDARRRCDGRPATAPTGAAPTPPLVLPLRGARPDARGADAWPAGRPAGSSPRPT